MDSPCSGSERNRESCSAHFRIEMCGVQRIIARKSRIYLRKTAEVDAYFLKYYEENRSLTNKGRRRNEKN